MRDAIVSGEVTPGEPVFESHLAEKLGMSRTPVREALSVLARDGILEIAPSRGYVVPQRSIDDLQELFELREGLEGMASRFAALRATDKEIRDLDQLCRRYDRARDLETSTRIGTEFHNKIYSACRNRRLAAILGSLKAQIVPTRRSALRSARTRRDEAKREHRAIMDAIRGRDPDAAEREARAHVRRSYRVLLDSYQSGLDPDLVTSNPVKD